MTIISSVLLSIFGLFNLLGIDKNLFFHQFVFVIIGFFAYFIIKLIGKNFFKINSKFFYWVFLIILLVTYFIGIEARGSRRWLNFYFFNFQASEFFKIFFIIYMAEFLAHKKTLENDLLYLIKSFFIFAFPALIIFKQPDLGNAAVYGFVYIMMIIFSRIPKKTIISFFGIFLLLTPFSWFFLHSYQKNRILSFLNPHLDTVGTSYNMIQAVITIGSGRFFGKGLGLGTQSRLFFLPENTTDFAFASLVEQFGFFGGFLVILFYAAIIYFLAKKAIKYFYDKNAEKSQFLFYIGVIAYFIFQIFVNIGMNMGLLPIAGVALPFISYGGSSVLAFMITLALL